MKNISQEGRVEMYLYMLVLFICLCGVKCDLDLVEGDKCTANNHTGRCVLYNRCLTLIQDRKDGINPQICSYKEKKPIICCTDCDLVDDIEKIVVDPKIGFQYKNGSKSWNYCLECFQTLPYICKQHLSSRIEREWIEKRQCHEIYMTAVGAAGGVDAKRGEFPHMALIGFGSSLESVQWLCGGSLISERFILTAAHCSASSNLGPATFAALGMLKRSDPDELWQKYKIEQIIVHPEYKSPLKYHDIALMKTDKSVKFSRDVLPACLHSRNTIESQVDWAYAMGWGALGNKAALADRLQKVVINKYTPEECSVLYPVHRHLEHGYDQTTQMCYGDKNDIKDTCQGDSGGPLVTNKGCMYEIMGVTSYGRACGVPGQAGMYTRVIHYVPWIESVVWP